MPTLNEKLEEGISDAHAMEKNVLRQLDSLIDRTPDGPMRAMFEQHRQETEGQIKRLEERLAAHDIDTAGLKDVVAQAGAFFKGLTDMARGGDKHKKNARDAYVTEHFEIAEYETLQRLATRAGDSATAEVAQQNCREEREMARKLDDSWDYVVDRTIQEEVDDGARFVRGAQAGTGTPAETRTTAP